MDGVGILFKNHASLNKNFKQTIRIMFEPHKFFVSMEMVHLSFKTNVAFPYFCDTLCIRVSLITLSVGLGKSPSDSIKSVSGRLKKT